MNLFTGKKSKQTIRRASVQPTWYQKEIVGFILAGVFLFISLAIFSYDPGDNTLLSYASDRAQVGNIAGEVGANIASLLLYFFGSAVYLFMFCLMVPSYLYLFNDGKQAVSIRCAFLPLLLVVGAALCHNYQFDMTSSYPGGMVGYLVCLMLKRPFGVGGTAIILWSSLWMSISIISNLSLARMLGYAARLIHYVTRLGSYIVHAVTICASGVAWGFRKVIEFKNRRNSVRAARRDDTTFDDTMETIVAQAPKQSVDDKELHREDDHEVDYWDHVSAVSSQSVVEQPVSPFVAMRIVSIQEVTRAKGLWHAPLVAPKKILGLCLSVNSILTRNIFSSGNQDEQSVYAVICRMVRAMNKTGFHLPSRSIFAAQQDNKAVKQLEQRARDRGEKLKEKLEHFGVKGRLTRITPGPLITMFEYTPEISSKISKITALEDDLAMALAAMSIRIIAPIPGKNSVGFEISNPTRSDVYFSQVVRTEQFEGACAGLPLALGVDVVGKPVITDLAKMPHLLVGGTTGSGKSVGLNGMLASLLCARRPDQLRLVLIDPKRLEFSPYADIPHLLFPIVTNPLRATKVLKWVVQEMERRYECMARVGVRNIQEYHIMQAAGTFNDSDDEMPFIVVMIDELADLMIVAGKEVEMHIVRIAQMARASGIHMIVATQRPSVDVVTGLIKVNFPSRIAFRVSSKVDSRTIIDERGAEKLLGRGDMLFKNSASTHLERIHGAYISDQEIEALTTHLRQQDVPNYLNIEDELADAQEQAKQDQDELYLEVLDFVRQKKEVSISMLQRQYRIGFNRSARIIQQLELDGVVTAAQGSKPRKII